jgi:hypothetical protein
VGCVGFAGLLNVISEIDWSSAWWGFACSLLSYRRWAKTTR